MSSRSGLKVPSVFIFVKERGGDRDRAILDQIPPLRKAGCGVSLGWNDAVFDTDTRVERRVESLWRTRDRHDHQRLKGQPRTIPRRDKSSFTLWFDGPWSPEQIERISALCRRKLGDNCAPHQLGLPNLQAA